MNSTILTNNILTSAVYTIGFACGSEALKGHPVYRHGGFAYPVEEFAANARPSFKDLKVAIKEATGLNLSGKAAEWLAVWDEGYVAAHIAI